MKRTAVVIIFLGLTLPVFLVVAHSSEVSLWTQSATQPWLTEILQEFTEETGITVESKGIGWGVEELYVAYAAGVMPDLFTHGTAALGALAEQGLMAPLDDIVQKWDFTKDIIPVVYDIARYKGQLVGMAWYGLTIESLVYHTEVFEEVGLSKDQPPESWDDLVTYGRKLTLRNPDGTLLRSGLHVADTSHSPSGWFRTFTLQCGLDPFGEELASITLLDDRIVSAVTFYVDLINTHRINDRGFAGTFLNRSSAMRKDSIAPFRRYPDEAPYLRVALLPYKEVPVVHIIGDFMSLASSSKNRDSALQLFEYIMHPDRQYRINHAQGFLPIFTRGIRWDWVREIPASHEFITLAMEHGYAATPHPQFFELRDMQNRIMRTALDGKNAPRVVLQEENDAFLALMRKR
ncbi:MAG: extracellular solute-binding protein [Firmicutes bacterium]|nr:extracellular solute-binding protein [Bacillota bacterium]